MQGHPFSKGNASRNVLLHPAFDGDAEYGQLDIRICKFLKNIRLIASRNQCAMQDVCSMSQGCHSDLQEVSEIDSLPDT